MNREFITKDFLLANGFKRLQDGPVDKIYYQHQQLGITMYYDFHYRAWKFVQTLEYPFRDRSFIALLYVDELLQLIDLPTQKDAPQSIDASPYNYMVYRLNLLSVVKNLFENDSEIHAGLSAAYSRYNRMVGELAYKLDKQQQSLPRIEVLKLIAWLLGYNDFPERKEGEGPHYWRTHLREKIKAMGIEISEVEAILEPEKPAP